MLWVKVVGRREIWGPYEDSRWSNIKTFARIGSSTGGAREIIFASSARSKPQVRRVYRGGKRAFPKSISPAFREAEDRFFSGRSLGELGELFGIVPDWNKIGDESFKNAKEARCYRSKSQALHVAFGGGRNLELAQKIGGQDSKYSGAGYEETNEAAGLRGGKKASTLKEAIWHSLSGKSKWFCVDRIDFDTLNKNPAVLDTGEKFLVPDKILEKSMLRKEREHYLEMERQQRDKQQGFKLDPARPRSDAGDDDEPDGEPDDGSAPF